MYTTNAFVSSDTDKGKIKNQTSGKTLMVPNSLHKIHDHI